MEEKINNESWTNNKFNFTEFRKSKSITNQLVGLCIAIGYIFGFVMGKLI